MYRNKVIAVVSLFFAIGVLTFSRSDGPIDAIKANLRASEAKDLKGVIATLEKKKADNVNTRETIAQMFDYDLNYDLEKAEVLQQDESTARVRTVQVTRDKIGGSFKDNRITAVHFLVKQDGKWKISSSEIKDLEYLN